MLLQNCAERSTQTKAAILVTIICCYSRQFREQAGTRIINRFQRRQRESWVPRRIGVSTCNRANRYVDVFFTLSPFRHLPNPSLRKKESKNSGRNDEEKIKLIFQIYDAILLSLRKIYIGFEDLSQS